MRLALVLRAEAVRRTVTGEAAALAGEDREDIKLLVMNYILEPQIAHQSLTPIEIAGGLSTTDLSREFPSPYLG